MIMLADSTICLLEHKLQKKATTEGILLALQISMAAKIIILLRNMVIPEMHKLVF